MKKLLMLAAVTMTIAAPSMHAGQGSVTFANIGVTDNLKVKDWAGRNLSGPGYVVALYWGDSGTTDDRDMTQIGAPATLGTGVAAGIFSGAGRTITYSSTSINGAVLALQVRGWATSGGTSYEEAFANGAPTGKNPIFILKTKDEDNQFETTPYIWNSPGYTGFQIVPEPSTIALGLSGVLALWVFRRK